jgi:O-antigen ligase
VTLPFASWLSLPAELGVPGLLAILALYGTVLVATVRRARAAMRRALPGDPLPALLLAGGIAIFVLLQMAFLENWLEVTRLTFVTMAIVAVGLKEADSRPAAPDGG